MIDVTANDQLKNCLAALEDIGLLTADAHYGIGHLIGGKTAYKNHVSLSGVGFDNACGNNAVRTNVQAADTDIKRVMT